MADLHAIPLEVSAGVEEFPAPVHDGLLDTGEDGLLVHELDRQQGGVCLPAPDEVPGQLCENQAVLAAAERQVDRDAVVKSVPDPCRGGGDHIHVRLYPSYSHIVSPQWGHTMD